MEIRCPFKLHGILVSDGVIEIKCDSQLCGANRKTVVLHRFDTETGDLLETIRYNNPRRS